MADSVPDTIPIPPLLTLGNPQLARPATAVDAATIATSAFQERLELLLRAMTEYLGIGIAAPQIGWFERLFVMALQREGADGSPEPVLEYWINPEIVTVSEELNWAWEGCLSVPGLRGWIRRPAAVAVRGHDARGEAVSRELAGWEARVFQHEYDHLDGMLLPYRAQDPRHLVMSEQLECREEWPDDWPAPGARDAPLGDVVVL